VRIERFHPWAARTLLAKVWRLVVSDTAYFVIYIAGGMAILPMVKEFYATRELPSPGVFASKYRCCRRSEMIDTECSSSGMCKPDGKKSEKKE
jgi:hypothetical protein